MPLLFIRTRDSGYYTRDDGADYDTPDAALAMGVRSAIAMVADEIGRGRQSAAVEVNVEREDGTRLLSTVVTMSVSPLQACEPDLRDGF